MMTSVSGLTLGFHTMTNMVLSTRNSRVSRNSRAMITTASASSNRKYDKFGDSKAIRDLDATVRSLIDKKSRYDRRRVNDTGKALVEGMHEDITAFVSILDNLKSEIENLDTIARQGHGPNTSASFHTTKSSASATDIEIEVDIEVDIDPNLSDKDEDYFN